MIRDFLDELGAAIEASGLTGVEDDVAVVVAAARSYGLHGVALEMLADDDAPEVARWRALAHLAPTLIDAAETHPRVADVARPRTQLDTAGC